LTAAEALAAANDAAPGERLRQYKSVCGPHGSCRQARSKTGPFGSYPIRQTVVTTSVIGSKLAALHYLAGVNMKLALIIAGAAGLVIWRGVALFHYAFHKKKL
jgi:hypothetical protein